MFVFVSISGTWFRSGERDSRFAFATMNKRPKPIFLVLGLVFSLLAGIVIGRALRYKHPTVMASLPGFSARNETDLNEPEPKFLIASPEDLPTEEDLATPDLGEGSNWMKFGNLNLLDGEVSFSFNTKCDDEKQVSIPPIQIIPWHAEVFDGEDFGIGKNVAIAWEHLGYEGLWIHSGWDFWSERSPATDLQYFLETDAVNEVQPLEQIESRLNDCLLGDQVSLEQQELIYAGQVAAVVRVPADGVEELSKHTMDLVPYLAQAYPEKGFADLDEGALLIYFCGRAALDERTDPNAGYWTQTRYVIALEPLD